MKYLYRIILVLVLQMGYSLGGWSQKLTLAEDAVLGIQVGGFPFVTGEVELKGTSELIGPEAIVLKNSTFIQLQGSGVKLRTREMKRDGLVEIPVGIESKTIISIRNKNVAASYVISMEELNEADALPFSWIINATTSAGQAISDLEFSWEKSTEPEVFKNKALVKKNQAAWEVLPDQVIGESQVNLAGFFDYGNSGATFSVKNSATASFVIEAIADANVEEDTEYTSVTPVLSGDAPRGAVIFTLSGNDSAAFTIDPATGIVAMIARDYENPVDANVDNVYELTITATDEDGNFAMENWIVTVVKANPIAGITNDTGTTVLTCTIQSIYIVATGDGTYSWSDGAKEVSTEAAFLITAPGTYTVTVTNVNGVTDTEFIIVTEDKTIPTAGITNNTGVTELSSATTSISLTGTGGVSYEWSTGATTATINVGTPGNYSVTVTGVNGCTSSVSISISQKELFELTVSGVVTDISCHGLTDGSIDLTVSGGKAPYRYSWSWYSGRNRKNKGQQEDISSLETGAYTVLVKDSNGVSVFTSFMVVSPSLLVISSSQTDISGCNSNESGSITPSASGGTGPYEFAIDTGQRLVDGKFTGLTAGAYTIRVRDANNCVNSKSITIKEAALISFISSKVNSTSCSANGSISVTASGGQSPYEYSKDSGITWQFSNKFTGLEAQSYAVTVRDALSCSSKSTSVVIGDNGSDAYEYNDIRRAAKAISVESSIQARIGVSGDLDWFKYTIPQNGSGTYYLIIDAPATGQVAQLYQGNGLLIVPQETGLVEGSLASYGSYNLSSGKKYYVRVSGTASLVCYNLKLSSSLNSNARLVENQSGEVQTIGIKDVPRKVNTEESYEVIAYPNPTKGKFKLDLSGFEAGTLTVKVMENTGRLLHEQEYELVIGNNTLEINPMDRAAGVYFVQVVQGPRVKMIRMIFE
jgi:hypothetical protein